MPLARKKNDTVYLLPIVVVPNTRHVQVVATYVPNAAAPAPINHNGNMSLAQWKSRGEGEGKT